MIAGGGYLILPTTSAPFIDVGSGRYVGHRTLAELQALGTGTPIKVEVGDTAWVTDRGRAAECLTAGASSSTWGYKKTAFMELLVNAANATASYLNWSSSAQRTAPNFDTSFLPLAPGRVRSMKFASSGTPGSTVFSFHRATAAGFVSTTATETLGAINWAAADTAYEAIFTAAASFVAGQRIGFKGVPTANWGSCVFTVELEYTITLT